MACFLFAAGFHSLLLLWQGGVLALHDQPGANLGNMLVQVNFMAEIPDYETPGGGAPAKPKSFLARMKSIITPKPSRTKTETLTDNLFVDKKGFQGMVEKDALTIAKGKTQTVLVKPSQGNFKKVEPNLKENTFQIARKDVPFKIAAPKNTDALANVNAIPVVVGPTTTPSVKSLDGGPGSGPALQSKSFASRGTNTTSNFGGGNGLSKNDGASGLLAMGKGTNTSPAAAGSMSQGGASGYGSGAGSGSGSSVGPGSGSGGRAWAGGGTGNNTLKALPRNAVPADSGPAGMKTVNNSGFNITGPLANRPIAEKSFARYEIDARVALRFRVDWSGKVLDGILVEISSGNPTFDQKVIASLKKWLFSRLSGDRTNEIQEGVITFIFKGV